MKRDRLPQHWTTCPGCGKHAFRSRRAARTSAKRRHPDDHNLNAYECPKRPGAWHYGHLNKPRDTYRRDEP